MNEITIAVKYDNDNPTVSGRELYQALLIKTPYTNNFYTGPFRVLCSFLPLKITSLPLFGGVMLYI